MEQENLLITPKPKTESHGITPTIQDLEFGVWQDPLELNYKQDLLIHHILPKVVETGFILVLGFLHIVQLNHLG
jgi:hypothetical protein